MDKLKNSNVVKIYKGGKQVVKNIKAGKFGEAYRTGRATVQGLNKPKKKKK